MYDATGVYFNPILTDFSVGYKPESLIWDQVAPQVPVPYQAGQYRVFDRSDWLIFEAHREPATRAKEVVGRKFSSDTYFCSERSLESYVTVEELRNLGQTNGPGAIQNAALFAGIDPMMDATRLVTRAILLGLENDVSTILRNTATYAGGLSTSLSGTARWDNYTGVSNPISDVQVAMRAIYTQIYESPNLMIIPWKVWTFIRNHPAIVDRVKYWGLGPVDAFQQLTGFDGTVVIPQSGYNTGDNVDAAESFAEFWGTDVILLKVDTAPQMNTKTFLKVFCQPYENGSVRPVENWYDNDTKVYRVRASMNYSVKVVSNTAGYIIKTVIS